jgi:hypothetical protein
MQQDSQSAPASQPSSPYDFIMKDEQQKSGKKSALPMPNLPKPVAVILAAIVALIIIIVFYSLIFGGKTSGTNQMVGVIGRANEIARISAEVSQASHDPLTQNLAATTQTALSSDSARLSTYLKSRKVKVDPARLKLYIHKTTDAEVQVALQNNNLSAYYISYLRTNLPDYANAIKPVYSNASVRSKPILSDAFNNAKVILTSPPVNAGS